MTAVRDLLEQSMAKSRKKKGHVGLAENKKGIAFQCGTCEYFYEGICKNKDPELNGREVEPVWCCDLFDHDGMRVIVA